MKTDSDGQRLEKRLGVAVVLSLLLNAAGLWSLAQTSPERRAGKKANSSPRTIPVAVEKQLPRLRGLLPSPHASPTPPPGEKQAALAASSGKLATPALPPPAYPPVVAPSPTTALPTPPPIPLATPLPVPTPLPGKRPAVQVALRTPQKTLIGDPSALPRGFKPLILPPPGAGGQPLGDKTGFNDAPTPKPKTTPAPTPKPEKIEKPEPGTDPTPDTETPTPKPEKPEKGETRTAEPKEKYAPEIPEGLKYKPQVRISVDVEADGAADYHLLSSSGNSEVDAYVLAALKRWRWSPALRDGKPIATSFEMPWNF